MAEIKVETDELLGCATRYKNLAENFNNVANSVQSKFREYENYWKGSFSTDLADKTKKLASVQKSIYSNCTQLASFINDAVAKYIAVDQGLANQTTINNADYPPVTVSYQEKPMSGSELQNLYNNSTNTTDIGYNDSAHTSISCAWLTKRKARQHGFDPSWTGNGNQVYRDIRETSDYSVTKYDGNNCLSNLITSEKQPITNVVISFSDSYYYHKGSSSQNFGHVIYIDQIVDGKVYFSDNTSPSTAKVYTIEEFMAKYNNSNGSALGCAHLKKK